jgi:hypothetical protein
VRSNQAWNGSPVIRSYASTYFSRVLATTSSGIAGAGGVLWVDQPAGQGLDASYDTFNLVTLAPVGGPFGGNLGGAGITDTRAGPLVLDQGNGVTHCPMPGTEAVLCLFRISDTATLSDPVVVGTAFGLLGPYPAVIAANAAGTALQLERFS